MRNPGKSYSGIPDPESRKSAGYRKRIQNTCRIWIRNTVKKTPRFFTFYKNLYRIRYFRLFIGMPGVRLAYRRKVLLRYFAGKDKLPLPVFFKAYNIRFIRVQIPVPISRRKKGQN
jgi:hypothetical protein